MPFISLVTLDKIYSAPKDATIPGFRQLVTAFRGRKPVFEQLQHLEEVFA